MRHGVVDSTLVLPDHHTTMAEAFHMRGRVLAGRRVSDLVQNLDVLPTVVELAGLPLPEGEWKQPRQQQQQQQRQARSIDSNHIDAESRELLRSLGYVQ